MAQLDALQRNDWPEADAGVRVAFAFSKPHGVEQLLPGQVPLLATCTCLGTHRRSDCKRYVYHGRGARGLCRRGH